MRGLSILSFIIIFLSASVLNAQSSLSFDGVDDKATVLHHADFDFGNGNFTIEAHVNNLGQGSNLTLLSKRDQQNRGFVLFLNTITHQFTVRLRNQNYTITNATIAQGNCFHLAAKRNNNTLTLFVNNSSVNLNITGNSNINTTADLLFGKDGITGNGSKQPLLGNLEEIRIWNTARSNANIIANANACLTGTNPNLVAYWNIEEQSGQFLHDVTGNGHHAYLGNSFFGDGEDGVFVASSCLAACCGTTASFTVSDSTPNAFQNILFTNTTIGTATYQWFVNDSLEATTTNFQYNFTTGVHHIMLIATNGSGCRSFMSWIADVGLPVPLVHTCGADELMAWRKDNDPNYLRSLQKFNEVTELTKEQDYIANRSPDGNYRIPVVFHIISDDPAVLASFDAFRIQAQLALLNDEFDDVFGGPEIMFCLAQNLPDGTTQWASFSGGGMTGSAGITYTLTTNPDLLTFDAADLQLNLINFTLPFPPEQYLSIYVVEEALVTTNPLAVGFSNVGPSFDIVDGVFVEQTAFTNGVIVQGKALVHEVGHWLGLRHVFSANLGGDDFVCDTYAQVDPTSATPVFGCNTPYIFPLPICTPPLTAIPYRQGENHMDYHTENCLTVFTEGQFDRMYALLDNGRPFIHSNINLVNTGVQFLGSPCADFTNVIADFSIFENGICAGQGTTLTGANVNYDSWTWTATWNPANNGGTPEPLNAVNFFPNTGSGQPLTNITITAPGIWDINLEVAHQGTIVNTVAPPWNLDEFQLQILDCTPNAERNRITSIYNNNDINLSYVSIDDIPIVNGDPARYIVSGSSLDITTNPTGEPDAGVLLCLDETGHTLWRRVIEETTGEDIRLFDIVSNVSFGGGNDRYALTGLITRAGNSEVLFLIMDRTGANILYQESFPITGFSYATGLQVVQLSAVFNNEFAIVGLASNCPTTGPIETDAKIGFVIGIRPNLGVGNAFRWSHFYQSIIPVTSLNDYDLAENIVEITADFGTGTPQPALVVGGNINMGNFDASAGFLSCLRVAGPTGQTVTEQWRNNFESASNSGATEMIATDFDNGRLFSACFSQLSHGTFVFEVNPTNGVILSIAENQGFLGSELIIDGGNCVLSGSETGGGDMGALSVPLPLIGSTSWPTAGLTISRRYADSQLNGVLGGVHTPIGYISKPQNIITSPNGGYMIVRETDIPPPNPIGISSIQFIANKVDNFLLSACSNGANYRLGALITILDDPMNNIPIAPIVTEAVITTFSTPRTELCNITNCNAPFTVNIDIPDYCFGTTTISGTAIPINGYPPFTYLWSNGQITQIATGLTVGSFYEVTVTDACGISATANITIPVPVQMLVNATVTNISCNGSDDGTISTNPNGLAPYTYIWSNGATTASINNLSVNTYSITITDANGCTATQTIAITEPNTLTITTSSTPAACGNNNGTATATPTGGTTPYTYSWSNNETTATITGLSAATYTVTVTDFNGCTATTSVSITETLATTATIISSTAVSCNGGSDGQATASAANSYLWSNGQMNQTATGLTEGTYTVTVTNANGCTATASVTITEPSAITISTTNTNLLCNGNNDATATVTASGGTGTYTYAWSNGETTTTVTGLASNIFTVTVTDGNGCTATASVTITDPPILTLNPTAMAETCAGNDGQVSAGVTGGTSPYTYSWSNGETTASITGLSANNYCVTVTDGNGCTVTVANCATVAPPTPDIRFSKSVSPTVAEAGQTVLYTIKIRNNCQTTINNISIVDALPAGINFLGFTSSATMFYDQTTRTLSTSVSLASGQSMVYEFEVQVIADGACNSNIGINNTAVASLGAFSQSASALLSVQELATNTCDRSAMQMDFKTATINGVLLPMTGVVNATNTAQNVVINGTWRLTQNTTYHFAPNSIITMEPGAQIILEPGSTLTLDGTTVNACRCMWHRILVQLKARLITRNNTIIQGGQYGVEAETEANLDISSTTFRNNFIGIFAARAGSPRNINIVNLFANNTFRSTRLIPGFTGIGLTEVRDAAQQPSFVAVPPIPLPGPGGGNNLDVPGLAGILVWDVIALNLNTAAPSASNQFIGSVAGIVAFNTNLSTNSCSFRDHRIKADYPLNLAFQGCCIHLQSREVYNLTVQGMMSTIGGSLPGTGTITFDNSDRGISGLGVSMFVQNCGIDRMMVGSIIAQNCVRSNLTFKSNLLARTHGTGISLANSDFNTTAVVYANDIQLRPINNSTFPTPSSAKIAVQVVEPAVNPHRLEIYQNLIDSRNGQLAISITGHRSQNSFIDDNTINMSSTSQTASRTGIGIFNSSIDMAGNQISGNNNSMINRPTTGITGSVANGVWECNSVNRTRTGMFFSGTNALVLEGNTFGNHTNGLHVTQLASIGQQFSNGNIWTGPTYNSGNPNPDAVNDNTPLFLVLASQFRINGAIPPPTGSLFPNNFGLFVSSMPSNWFLQSFSYAPDFSCISPQNISPLVVNPSSSVDLRDIAIANNAFAPSTASEYHGKRNLFRKLSENPNLTQADPSLPPFVPNHQNGCIGHFDNVQQQCSQAFTICAFDSLQIDTFQKQCEFYLDSLHCLDSMLYVNYDTITRNLRATLATDFSNIIQQQQAFLTTLIANQQSDLALVQTVNNNFNTTILFEQLEKQVNEIYLNTLALGVTEFTPAQLADLQVIAAYCPREGGAAVHQARAMLSLVEDVNLLDFDCNTSQAKKAQDNNAVDADLEWDITLYPNPAQDVLTIQSNLALENAVSFEIYNALGQLVKSERVVSEGSHFELDIRNFIDGIYTLRVQKENESISKTFIVSK